MSLFHCIEVLCESLLCSEVDENINLVRDIMEYKPADALFKTKSAMLYILSVYKIGTIPLESRVKIIRTASEYYLDSSKDVDDPNLELAKRCLDLVKEQPETLNTYYDLLNALQMLHEFGVSILPIVLRNTTNYQPIVQKILQLDPSAYKSVRKILKLIRLTASEKTGLVLDEAPIFSLVADHALKATDYDYCLSICDMMMANPSKEACKVCLDLVNCEDFVNVIAKTKLASFCVNFCDDDDIEDMLVQRITLTDELSYEMAPPPPTVVDALSKLASDSGVNNVLPQTGTRVINSLFDKLSKFTPILSGQETTEEEMQHESPVKAKKAKKVAINVFYEDIYPGAMIGKLHANLEHYAATANSQVDRTTLSLLSKHYRNCFEYDDEEKIDWPILRDILNVIVEQDSGLAVALMVAEVQQHPELIEDFIVNTKRPPFGLFIASLQSFLATIKSREAFSIPPGILFAASKTLMLQDQLSDNGVLRKAIELSSCDDDDDE